MTEVLFYHLLRQPLERVLPQLLETSPGVASDSAPDLDALARNPGN